MSVDTSEGHPAMDYDEHQKTYKGFLTVSKIGGVLIVAILAAMAYFLV